MKRINFLIFAVFLILIEVSCGQKKKDSELQTQVVPVKDSTSVKAVNNEVIVEKDFLYNEHTLSDTYPYRDTVRMFQWEKIHSYLKFIDSIQSEPSLWGILQNRNNRNGESVLVKAYRRDAYSRVVDTFGIERYQGIPLFEMEDTITPERYGLDGSLVKLAQDSTFFITASPVYFGGMFKVPKRYVKPIGDTIIFHKVIFVDRINQNIATLEKVNSKWLVRSMNPATTGLHKPPLMQETPLGIFIIQEKKAKMVYLKDESIETGGFAPYASRFCNGGYIHGVPVNEPRKTAIEFSSSLGTTPRSHMCVRNATSHAKFVYDWAPVEKTLVIVFE